MRRWGSAVTWCAVCVTAGLQIGTAQSAGGQDDTAKISGVVLDASSKRPLPDVVVKIGSGASSQSFVTDARGAFVCDHLRAGRLALTASLNNYVGGRFGQRFSDDSDLPLVLAAGEQRSGIEIRLWPLGVITGIASDSKGQPISRGRVLALRQASSRDHQAFRRAADALTDDRGQYRLSLPAGTYLIALESSLSRSPTVYYPSAASIAASMPIGIVGGEQRNVDLGVPPQQSFRLGGRLLKNDVNAAYPIRLSLVETGAGSRRAEVPLATASPASDGGFVFPSVFPGQYLVRASQVIPGLTTARLAGNNFSFASRQPPVFGAPLPPMPESEVAFGEVSVSVTDRNLDVEVPVRRAGHISGNVTFDGKAPTTNELLASSLILVPVDGRDTSVPITRLEADGTFKTVGLAPGQYGLGLLLSFPGYILKSVLVDRRDVIGDAVTLGEGDLSGVTLVMTSRQQSLTGSVHATTGGSIEGASVYVFPRDRSLWDTYFPITALRWVTVRSGRDGSFELKSLPPGTYLVAAVVGDVQADWPEKSYLEWLGSMGTTVTLDGTRNSTVTVKAARWSGRRAP